MAIQPFQPFSHRLHLPVLALTGGALLSLIAPAYADAGLSFSTSGVISDRVELQQQRIVSSAWLSYLNPMEMNSHFVSDSTPPAPGRRVVIRNVTPGFETQPFSDRAYDTLLGSEVIRLKSGQGHETKTFTVLPGRLSAPKQNIFSYEIRDNDGTLLESGGFSLGVTINDRPITTVYLPPYNGYPAYSYAPDYYGDYPIYGGYGGDFGSHDSVFYQNNLDRDLNRNLREYLQELPPGLFVN